MNFRTPPQYLARGEYDQSAYDEAIGLRIEKLMDPGADADPLEARNFDEAISELLASFPNDLSPKLVQALRDGVPANKILIDASTEYWTKYATNKAQTEHEADRERAAEDSAEAMRGN